MAKKKRGHDPATVSAEDFGQRDTASYKQPPIVQTTDEFGAGDDFDTPGSGEQVSEPEEDLGALESGETRDDATDATKTPGAENLPKPDPKHLEMYVAETDRRIAQDPDAFFQFLNVVRANPELTIRNIKIGFGQNENATMLRTMDDWADHGRYPAKDACPVYLDIPQEGTDQSVTQAYYDIRDTSGPEIQPPQLTGDDGKLNELGMNVLSRAAKSLRPYFDTDLSALPDDFERLKIICEDNLGSVPAKTDKEIKVLTAAYIVATQLGIETPDCKTPIYDWGKNETENGLRDAVRTANLVFDEIQKTYERALTPTQKIQLTTQEAKETYDTATQALQNIAKDSDRLETLMKMAAAMPTIDQKALALIMEQNPDATFVQTKNGWQMMNVSVDQNAIPIDLPVYSLTSNKQIGVIHSIAAFDISQTNAKNMHLTPKLEAVSPQGLLTDDARNVLSGSTYPDMSDVQRIMRTCRLEMQDTTAAPTPLEDAKVAMAAYMTAMALGTSTNGIPIDNACRELTQTDPSLIPQAIRQSMQIMRNVVGWTGHSLAHDKLPKKSWTKSSKRAVGKQQPVLQTGGRNKYKNRSESKKGIGHMKKTPWRGNGYDR